MPDPAIAGLCTPVFSGQRVTVMGLGRFGGGAAAARFLAERGAHVTVTDLADAARLADSLAQLRDLPIERFILGRHEPRDFAEADLVVVSPAVPRNSPFLDIARTAGVPLSSEMNLFWQFNRGRTIGITGSSGKSTTAALTHAILQAAGLRVRLGGNIGVSLLPVVDQIDPAEWVVLELSSFQLEDLDRLQVSPDIAVITNFSPNHLDRHGTLDAYRAAKQTILRWQSPTAIAVLNRDDPDVSTWPVHGQRLWFGTALPEKADGPLFRAGMLDPTAAHTAAGVFLDSRERGPIAVARLGGTEATIPLADCLRLPGSHNAANAAAAIAASLSAGATATAIPAAIASFNGLPHRLQFVGEVAGRRFYNDSKATTPEAAILALESFDRPIILLAGGSDKHVDLTDFAQTIRRRARAVALLGETGPRLQQLLQADPTPSPADRPGTPAPPPTTRLCTSFPDACRWAWTISAPGDILLLAPGCASYDWFHDYTDRGDQFTNFLQTLPHHATTTGLVPVET